MAKVIDLTRRLDEAGRAYGSDPEVSSAAATWATRLLDVPGAEPVKQALKTAVAELHIQAGWDAFDACLQALALSYAGLATEEHGHPDDGLKMLQYGQMKAWDIHSDDQRKKLVGMSSRMAMEACARADSATALARLGCWDAADAELATSRELWQPTRPHPIRHPPGHDPRPGWRVRRIAAGSQRDHRRDEAQLDPRSQRHPYPL